jgi:Phage integrase family
MLRHPCGYALANKGHDIRAIQGWLGHRSITSTAVYTAGAEPFQGLLAGVSVALPASPRHARDVSSPDDGQRDQGSEDHQHHGGEITHHYSGKPVGWS